MAGLTAATAQAQLDLYLAAEAKVLTGQEYEIAGRRLKRADLTSIREGIAYWNAEVQRLSSGSGARVRGLTLG